MTTDRISLRAVEPGDADFMYEVDNDSSAWAYSDTIAPLSRKMLRDYALDYDADPLRCGQLRLIVTENGTGRPVGILDLYEISPLHRRAFTGIYILKDFRRTGYAIEALRQVADYVSRHLRITRLWARIPAANFASAELFRKAGFSQEASLHGWFDAPGPEADLHIFSLTTAAYLPEKK